MKKVKNEKDKNEISVSIDRIKYTLLKYRNRKSILAELISYFGSIITLLITVTTAQYTGFWFFTAEMLQGIFIALLCIMIIIFLSRFLYLFWVRKTIHDEESFIDSLEYSEKIITVKARNRKLNLFINGMVGLFVVLIIGLYIYLGFLAKWHWAYWILVSFIALMVLGFVIGGWDSIVDFFYTKLKHDEYYE